MSAQFKPILELSYNRLNSLGARNDLTNTGKLTTAEKTGTEHGVFSRTEERAGQKQQVTPALMTCLIL